jgi:multidrug efflux pump subunit AcrA (membrane-fusion protein)
VGDSVYSNQPFLMILDFDDLVVEIAVPEAELGSIRPGNPALIQPTAWPELRLAGVVEQVSEMAQALPDRPASQRYFRALLGVRESDPRLRPGMSVVAQVVTYRQPDALLVPRRAVRFEQGEAHATVVAAGRRLDRRIEVGHAGETDFEVLEGLAEGDRVLIR